MANIKNRLKALKAKEDEFTIPDTDIVLNLRGLTFNEMSEMVKYGGQKDNAGAARFLLFTALRRALPKEGTMEGTEDIGASDKEINEMIDDWDSGVATAILTKVQELSGIRVPEEKN